MRRRGAALLVAAAMASLSLAACGGSGSTPSVSNTSEAGSSAGEAKKEGVSQDTLAQASSNDIEWPKGTVDILSLIHI